MRDDECEGELRVLTCGDIRRRECGSEAGVVLEPRHESCHLGDGVTRQRDILREERCVRERRVLASDDRDTFSRPQEPLENLLRHPVIGQLDNVDWPLRLETSYTLPHEHI